MGFAAAVAFDLSLLLALPGLGLRVVVVVAILYCKPWRGGGAFRRAFRPSWLFHRWLIPFYGVILWWRVKYYSCESSFFLYHTKSGVFQLGKELRIVRSTATGCYVRDGRGDGKAREISPSSSGSLLVL